MTAPPTTDAPLISGVPGLDLLLRGGLRRGALHVVSGSMGAGKTVLAHQIAAHAVRDGGTALYLTSLIEAHQTLIAQARSFSFYVPGSVPNAMYYASLFPALARGGLRAVSEEVARSVGERTPTLLVLDGLDALALAGATPLEYHRFLHDLEALAALTGVTMLALVRPAASPGRHDEAGSVLADGVIALRTTRLGLRRARSLGVLKMRGVAHVRGWHAAEITGDGVRVYPRIETTVAAGALAASIPDGDDLAPSGVGGLDAMLGGGFPRGGVVLMPGMAGSGKTLLGCAFLAGAEPVEERGLYFGFHETPDRLIAKAETVGVPLGRAVASGRVRVHWQPPAELLSDALAEQVLAAVDEHGARRVVIDGLDDVRRGIYPRHRELDFLSAFFDLLRARGVVTVVNQDLPRLVGPAPVLPLGEVSPFTDVLLHLRTEERGGSRTRYVSVLKTRTRAHDESLRELRIGAGGISVAAHGDPPRGPRDRGAAQ